jgi:hypothetical protein
VLNVRVAWGRKTGPDGLAGAGDGLRGVRGPEAPGRRKAVWKLPDGDLDYINVTITELHYDAGAAGPASAPAPEGGAR